ncbi:MAG: tRNA (adenosine(37)-N6)-threonylcarbamoyltransferase complex dimerization subunit type 1 TsaB [Endomicrobiaceae bacterium]|nr:tRNA (adenosine(37)-N6)-threonylcarbamoyltransferase complex dimerization subunit type 1 TsaB [Endomicrobiaceae bacterium]
MKILAIETSGLSLSVAVGENGKVILEYFFNAGMIHSETLIPTIEKILNEINWQIEDIDKFAVSSGPGSFTGIRVGMTTVKTLAQSLNKPVVCVDCLSILEESIKLPKIKIVSAIDALRNEVFIKQKKDIIIISIEKFIEKNKKYKNNIIVVGNAVTTHKKILSKHLGNLAVSLSDKFHFPLASTLVLTAENIKGKSFKEVEPLYIRKSWAEEK